MILDLEDPDDLKRFFFYDFLSSESGMDLPVEQLEDRPHDRSKEDYVLDEYRKDMK
jgi:hypothetical protein